ncbi:MAG: hypothetical protein H6728_06480 [Myxococcales bacterium]|nr:hypothetical protein [Myxococcales bacterium]
MKRWCLVGLVWMVCGWFGPSLGFAETPKGATSQPRPNVTKLKEALQKKATNPPTNPSPLMKVRTEPDKGAPSPVMDDPNRSDADRLSIAFFDFIWPRKGAIARWELQLGAQLSQAFHDAYSPLNLPFSLGLRLTAYDAIKRFRWRPFMLFLAFEENGRADRYDTVNYAYNVFDVDVAVHIHPLIHFYYDLSILRSGSEMHVSDAGLSVRMGVRIPFWFKDRRPFQYDQNHLHLVLLPVSASLLGSLNRDNLKGFNNLQPSLNGHAGLEFYMTPLPWLGIHAQAYAHLNFNLEQSLLLRGRAGVNFSIGRFVSVSLAMLGQWYPKPPPIRTNLYTLYFLQFPSVSGELLIDIRFSEWLKNNAEGAH